MSECALFNSGQRDSRTRHSMFLRIHICTWNEQLTMLSEDRNTSLRNNVGRITQNNIFSIPESDFFSFKAHFTFCPNGIEIETAKKRTASMISIVTIKGLQRQRFGIILILCGMLKLSRPPCCVLVCPEHKAKRDSHS